jgi:hypothetical protein
VFETNLHKSRHLTQFVVTFSGIAVTNVKTNSNNYGKAISSSRFGRRIIYVYYLVCLFYYALSKCHSTPGESRKKESLDWQKPGILVLGIGVGLFIVGILDNYINTELARFTCVAILIISAGVAMIIANRLDKKRDI